MSHPAPPPPRPALRKAPDGSVHPAATVLSSLAVSVPADTLGADRFAKAAKKAAKKDGKAKRGRAPEETVDLVVTLPKHVRKALRKRAAGYGWTAEEAAAQVLRVWADR